MCLHCSSHHFLSVLLFYKCVKVNLSGRMQSLSNQSHVHTYILLRCIEFKLIIWGSEGEETEQSKWFCIGIDRCHCLLRWDTCNWRELIEINIGTGELGTSPASWDYASLTDIMYYQCVCVCVSSTKLQDQNNYPWECYLRNSLEEIFRYGRSDSICEVKKNKQTGFCLFVYECLQFTLLYISFRVYP